MQSVMPLGVIFFTNIHITFGCIHYIYVCTCFESELVRIIFHHNYLVYNIENNYFCLSVKMFNLLIFYWSNFFGANMYTCNMMQGEGYKYELNVLPRNCWRHTGWSWRPHPLTISYGHLLIHQFSKNEWMIIQRSSSHSSFPVPPTCPFRSCFLIIKLINFRL